MNDYDQKMVNNLKDIVSDVSKDVYFTDFDYLRWLQGYDYNMDAVAPKLRHHLLCLRSYDFENFERNEILDSYWPQGFIKSAGHGNLFPYIETQGTWDGDGIMKCVSKVDILLHCMFRGELVLKVLRNQEMKSGSQSGLIFIVDLEGAQVTAKNLQILSGSYKDLVNFMLKHYVEITNKLIVVNANMVLWTLYNVIKSVLPEKTRQKFIVLGSNWKTDLLQYCDPDTLPVHYGGTLMGENNDPKCQSQVVYCTKVPDKLYWTPSADDPKPEDLTTLTVPKGTASYITVEITKKDSILEWYYATDNSWGFGIFFTENEKESITENMEIVFPQFEHFRGATIVPEKGRINCKKCGIYKIWFNNSFSWFTKLNVSYKINVTT